MTKREKKAKFLKSDVEESNPEPTSMRSEEKEEEDEDAEANEDLSLKIVEKAMLRACSNATGKVEAVVLTNLKDESGSNNKEKKKKKKKDKSTLTPEDPVSSGTDKDIKSFCSDMFQVDSVKEEENLDTTKATNIGDGAAEKNPAEISDNAVLRRLLRGPRYFDAPGESWGACFNCGEEGHAAVNCTSARRQKPCFVCGSFDHNAKNCVKGKACFICKKGGHRASDCPEKSRGGSQSSKMCLKCGDSGHDMFSCWNDYCADDLKEIQCYICKSFGHLCCAEYPDDGPKQLSCYKCGQLGHTGLACTGSHGETSGAGSLNSCYRCGEEGHFARECTNASRVNKRNRELSTPKKKVHKKKKEKNEFRSVPRDFGRAWKKGKHEGGYTSGYKMKRRGGWIPDDREEPNSWRSPSTPGNKRANFSGGGYASGSGSRSYRKSNRLDFDDSASYGSGHHHHRHGFHASRFSNSSHDRWRRNYDW